MAEYYKAMTSSLPLIGKTTVKSSFDHTSLTSGKAATALRSVGTSSFPFVAKADASHRDAIDLHRKKIQRRRRPTDSAGSNVFRQRRPEVGVAESPSRVLSDKTFIDETTSQLAGHLERFHRLVAAVGTDQLETVRQRVDVLLAYIMPRLARLGIRVGLKIIGSVKTGSAFDDTKVLAADEVEAFVMFDPSQLKTVMSNPGYVTIPLPSDECQPAAPAAVSDSGGESASRDDTKQRRTSSDRWKFGRSANRKYLSPRVVSRTMHGLLERVERASIGTEHEFQLTPFVMENNRSPITVLNHPAERSQSLKVNLIPACAVCDMGSHLPPVGTITYVVARPYQFDRDPESDSSWRLSTVDRETRLLDSADRADRGTRRKAIRLLKALAGVEPALDGLSSYLVRTAALYALDRAVDGSARWQRESAASAFLDLLAELDRKLSSGRFCHFFFRRLDLLESVPTRTVDRWQSRVRCLVDNRAELIRVLRRRTEDHLVKESARLTRSPVSLAPPNVPAVADNNNNNNHA